MSDSVLRIFPAEPERVPTVEQRRAALALFRELLPRAEAVTAHVHRAVTFVDAGGNFDGVRCPACDEPLDEVWPRWMDEDAARQFASRVHTAPCCGREVALEDLAYAWPVGFARFVLEARNPGLRRGLAKRALGRLGRALGGEIREVLAHY